MAVEVLLSKEAPVHHEETKYGLLMIYHELCLIDFFHALTLTHFSKVHYLTLTLTLTLNRPIC